MALFVLFCTILYSAIGHCARPTLTSNPNIIFIIADDLRYTTSWADTNGPYHLAPEGNSLDGQTISYLSIPTPNINALMDESVLIPRTYSGGSQCAPSRFAILTGRQPVRSGYAEDWTVGNGNYDPTLGTFVAVPFTKIDTDDENAYNLAAILSNNAYRTGMFGKWHLTSDLKDNLGCTTLSTEQDQTLYDECLGYAAAAGFDEVDAFYFSNIDDNVYFSHNPEWKISEAKKFMARQQNQGNNFFVYIGLTLGHSNADAYTALQDTEGYLQTPKGTLSASDDPSATSGMKPRDILITEVNRLISLLGVTTVNDKKTVASTVWIDEAVRTLITFLTASDLYDNTLFVFVNDHGVPAKGTVYEHGTRQLQVIRFPPYWSLTSAYIAPDDFVTSTVDLAAVVYDILGITDDVIGHFDIDGTSWIDDLFDIIDNNASSYSASCCTERYADAYYSHAIMTNDELTYIYNPGDWGLGELATYYANNEDEEQLYDMSEDPNQQTNVINDVVYATRVEELRTLMDAYITNKACPDGYTCVTPLTASLTLFLPDIRNIVMVLLFCTAGIGFVVCSRYFKRKKIKYAKVSIVSESETDHDCEHEIFI